MAEDSWLTPTDHVASLKMDGTPIERGASTGISFARANYSGSPRDIEIKNAQMLAGRKALALASSSSLAHSLTEGPREINSDSSSDGDSMELRAWGSRASAATSDTTEEEEDIAEEPTGETDLARAADCPLEDDTGAFWMKIISAFPVAVQPWMHVVVKMFVLYVKSRFN